ncbi:MAG: aminodeoxychorismate synthase component I [Gammaproteobacteria bacterium]|nr:aminodeoxychorismate synthase component I [Gammaproteobacteria bacterium]
MISRSISQLASGGDDNNRHFHVETNSAAVDLAWLHQKNPERYPYLLQSAASGTAQGRFDILFAFPRESIVLDSEFKLNDGRTGDFLTALDTAWRSERVAERSHGLPFTGGWFLYLAYELAGQVEPGLCLMTDPDMPIAIATRIPVAAISDRQSGQTYLVAESGHEQCLKQLSKDLAGGFEEESSGSLLSGLLQEDPEQIYLDAVETARRFIYDGDIFQANLSRQWRGKLLPGTNPAQVYRRLCSANPAPFAGLARWQNHTVISSSPERLLKISNGYAESRPIAGTRPRDHRRTKDSAMREELLRHPKERAEHIMLIDLERNDLGRVCRPGSVEVDEMMSLESYAHVHHIVSNVRGRLREEVSPGQVIRAMFPGGTITGCPKVRCMEIISQLEGAPRGAYTGSMGYLNRDGSADLNILIRTLVQDGDQISLRAGSGIVADSVAREELAESRAKAKGLILALGAA